MSYRDRRYARADRLRGWADKRDAKSAAAFDAVHAIADNIPLGQPLLVGHHSYRRARRDQDRIHSGMRSGIDHAAMADSMRSRAANIDAAADKAIYSDDPDAADRLAAKIAALVADRDAIVAFNKAARKDGDIPALLAGLSPALRDDYLSIARFSPYQLRGGAFPAYASGNISGNISRLRARLAALG